MRGASRSLLFTVGLALLASLPAGAQSVRICAIQGSGPTPNMLGSRVTAGGVVTADFQPSLGGFFMQEPGCDGDATTSDGIFVRTGTRPVTVVVGHRVTVTGRVSNDFGLTAIELESVADAGPYAGTLEAVRLSPPVDAVGAAAYLESFEGMLVVLPPSRVVAATNHFGEAYVMPESSGVTRLYRGDADGRKLGVAAPAGWLALSQGDLVSEVVGPLTYTFGQFKVEVPPERSVTVERSGVRPPEAAALSSTTLSVATYNLENLFDPVDDPGKDDDVPTAEQYAANLTRRATSIARYLGLPDVLGVQEVEKIEVLQDLAAQPALLPAAYRAVLLEGIDVRGIDVGLLYNSQRLWLRSAESRQGCSDVRPPDGAIVGCALPGGGSGYMLFSRPPLVVRLETLDDHERLTVVVNHFKSQSGDTTADDRLRLGQADFVRAVVEELKGAEADVPVIVLGDLNDFEDSPPLQHLRAGGRLLAPPALPASGRPYTYVFQGLCQTLDHILVDAALMPRVVELRPLHVNVDFADPGPGAPAEAGPHASDHDPVRLLLSRR
jgi:predicted extracellular nuclease